MKKQSKMNMLCRLAIVTALPVALISVGSVLSGCAVDSNAQNAVAADPLAQLRAANELAEQAATAELAAEDFQRRGEPASKVRVKQEEALVLYQRSIAAYRDYAPAWNNMGKIYMDQGRSMEAKEAFVTAAELAPTDPRAMSNLGLLWEKLQYADEAQRAYESALSRNPQYLPALRQAIMLDVTFDRITQTTAERIKEALVLETDSAWKERLSRAKILVDDRNANSREIFAR